jgi:hypothetical protein
MARKAYDGSLPKIENHETPVDHPRSTLVGNTTYGQITIRKDSILADAGFTRRQEIRVVEGLRVNVSIFSAATSKL